MILVLAKEQDDFRENNSAQLEVESFFITPTMLKKPSNEMLHH
jgi:hypothetical protein